MLIPGNRVYVHNLANAERSSRSFLQNKRLRSKSRVRNIQVVYLMKYEL